MTPSGPSAPEGSVSSLGVDDPRQGSAGGSADVQLARARPSRLWRSMSFASPVFLWYFMPATLLAYWVLPRTWRNGLVAVASLLFYTWGAGPYTFLLLSAIAVNYAAGLAIDAERPADRPGLRRAVLAAAVAVGPRHPGHLEVRRLRVRSRSTPSPRPSASAAPPIVELALPIGISFFTFHHISYVVDVYRHSRRGAEEPGPVRHLHRDVPAARGRPDRPLPRDRRPAGRHRGATGSTTSRWASRGSPGAWPRRWSSPTRSRRSPTPRSPRPAAT